MEEPDNERPPGLDPAQPQEPSGLVRAARAAGVARPPRTGRVVARGSTSAYTAGRRFTQSGGARESGLSRLLELHAFNTAGDAAFAVALAGTLFFTVPTAEATGQVTLFLVLTMLPFAVVAPLIGPFLDRFRRGRRWAIGATLAVRAFCCWVLAGAISDSSPPPSFYFAALGCLVASKAYGVTRAAAVPRLLPPEFTLVKANSRISLTGTGAGAISAPLAIARRGDRCGVGGSLRRAAVRRRHRPRDPVARPGRLQRGRGEGRPVQDLDRRQEGHRDLPRRRQRPAQQLRAAAAVGIPDDLHGVHAAHTAGLDALARQGHDPARVW